MSVIIRLSVIFVGINCFYYVFYYNFSNIEVIKAFSSLFFITIVISIFYTM